MPDLNDDIDHAYRAAVAANEDSAAVQRRRAAVLQAVQALGAAATPGARPDAEPTGAGSGSQTASKQSRRHLSHPWWRGAAAACLLASTALVVLHLREDRGGPTATGTRRNAGGAAQAGPPRPALDVAAEKAGRHAEAAPRQSPAAPAAPAAAIVTDAVRRAPARPDTGKAGEAEVSAIAVPALADKAAGSAFPGAENQAADASGRVGTAGPSASSMPRIDEQAGARNDAQAGAAAPTAAGGPVASVDPAAKAFPTSALAARQARPAAQASRSDLLAAVTAGDIDAVRRMLPTTNPDAERDPDGRTALAIAVLRSDPAMAKLLIASGANRRAQDRFGQTPAGYAQASGDILMRQAFESP